MKLKASGIHTNNLQVQHMSTKAVVTKQGKNGCSIINFGENDIKAIGCTKKAVGTKFLR